MHISRVNSLINVHEIIIYLSFLISVLCSGIMTLVTIASINVHRCQIMTYIFPHLTIASLSTLNIIRWRLNIEDCGGFWLQILLTYLRTIELVATHQNIFLDRIYIALVEMSILTMGRYRFLVLWFHRFFKNNNKIWFYHDYLLVLVLFLFFFWSSVWCFWYMLWRYWDNPITYFYMITSCLHFSFRLSTTFSHILQWTRIKMNTSYHW